MSVERVLDTNVLVYAVSSLSEDAPKAKRAVELISEGPFGVSGQIVQEFFVTVTRKIKTRLSVAEAMIWIEQLEQQPCVAIDIPLIKRGIEIAERFQTSYWDGAVLAAAETLGATTLYTEDLNHGQTYGSVKVVNPFKI